MNILDVKAFKQSIRDVAEQIAKGDVALAMFTLGQIECGLHWVLNHKELLKEQKE